MVDAGSLRQPEFPRFLTPRRAAWIAAAVAVIAYANSLTNGFCQDDLPIVALNPRVTGRVPLKAVWLTDYWYDPSIPLSARDSLYRPLSMLSYRLNYSLAGPSPVSFHVVNAILHAWVSAMVVRLTTRLLGNPTAGLIAGVFFAVLPIHTEAVNNIVGRAELMAALGTAGGALFALSAPGSRRPVWSYCLISAAWTFLAVASKESGAGVTLIMPWCALYSVWILRRNFAQGDRGLLKPALWLLGGEAVGMTMYLGLRYAALQGQFRAPGYILEWLNPLTGADWVGRIRGAIQIWGMYWAKTFWPSVLVTDYTPPAVYLAPDWADSHVLLGLAIATVLITWIVVRCVRRDYVPALLTAGLLASYAPVANALVIIRIFFAERVWYVPSIWAVILVVAAGWHLYRWALARLPARALQWSTATAISLAALAATVRTLVRNPEWRDDLTIYAAAYRDCPTSIGVLAGYGYLLAKSGHAEGIAMMRQAVLTDVSFTMGQYALGLSLLNAGRPAEAIEPLQIALAQNPKHILAREALATARQKIEEQARTELNDLEHKAAENPDNYDALNAYSEKLLGVGQAATAVSVLEAAESRFRSLPEFWHHLATVYVMAARPNDGIEAYHKALELSPHSPGTAVELAMLLMERQGEGDLGTARKLLQKAAEQAPDNIQVRMGLAEFAAQDGRHAEAARIYRGLGNSLPPGELRDRCLLQAALLSKEEP